MVDHEANRMIDALHDYSIKVEQLEEENKKLRAMLRQCIPVLDRAGEAHLAEDCEFALARKGGG